MTFASLGEESPDQLYTKFPANQYFEYLLDSFILVTARKIDIIMRKFKIETFRIERNLLLAILFITFRFEGDFYWYRILNTISKPEAQ